MPARRRPLVLVLVRVQIFNRTEVFRSSGLEHGLMVSGVVAQPVTELLPSAPPRCSACGAYVCKYSPADTVTGQWRCVFCSQENTADELRNRSVAETPVLRCKLLEHLAEAQGPAPPPESVLFILDLNASAADLRLLLAALLAAVQALPGASTLGLLTYTNTLAVWELPLLAAGVARSELIAGDYDFADDDLRAFALRRSAFLAPAAACAPHLPLLVQALEAYGTDRPAGFRCLGTAARLGLALLRDWGQPHEAETEGGGGRLVLVAGGPPNLGRGSLLPADRDSALAFYRELAAQASAATIVFDIFCCGLRRFEARALQRLSEATGGALVLLPGYAAPFASSLSLALARVTGRHGRLQLRCSHPLRVTQVIGPAAASAASEEKRGLYTSYRLELTCVEARQGLAVLYELADDALDDHAYVQLSLAYRLPDGRRLLRVLTQRLGATGNRAAFLASVDADAAALLLAKQLVAAARRLPDPEALQPQLDARLRRILAFATPAPAGALPPNLTSLPHTLFLLRRGPLLGPILQHEDDIDALRALFLFACEADALRILRPRLYACLPPPADAPLEAAPSFMELPLEDLALQGDLVLYLDHHTDIFVWSGRQAAAPAYDSLRRACLARAAAAAAGRFPSPQVAVFNEGASMARWLACRLVPAHKDPRHLQLLSFPQLAHLPPAALAALVAKFHYTDDLSFHQYHAQLTGSA